MKGLLTTCAALLLLTRFARASESVHEFECDTPAGHSSHWSTTISSSKVAITGTIEIKEKLEHERWNPVASVFLIAKGSGSAFGLQVYTLKSQKEFLFLRLTKPDAEAEAPFAMLPADTTTIPFSLTLAANGTLDVTTADKSASISIKDFAAEKVMLSCSTGDFRFSSVKIR